MAFATGAGFDYGNARLRARKASLIDSATYAGLQGRDLEGLLGALSETAYRPDLEAAVARFSGLQALREAVRHHLARSLEELRAFYRGSARAVVDLLLSRWDLHNLLTLLRGQATGSAADETVAGTVPIGAIDEAAAGEVARQSEIGRAVELLVSWRLPNAALAAALARAWPAYLRTEELPLLERALAAAHSRGVVMGLEGQGEGSAPLRLEVARGVDVQNALTVLRLQGAEEAEQARAFDQSYLPGGRLTAERLRAAVEADDPTAAAAALAEAIPEDALAEALRAWSPDHGMPALQAELERRRTRAAVRLFGSGDPLGAAVPVAFAAAKENEARNLRLLGDGAARGVAPDELHRRLVLLEESPR
jgi:V/A-type H+-transporting ATPase subunit C